MAFRIIFALTLAAFGLLLLAERLGLAASFAQMLAFAIILVGGFATALFAAATRFGKFFLTPFHLTPSIAFILGVVFLCAFQPGFLSENAQFGIKTSLRFVPLLAGFSLSALVLVWLPIPSLKAAQECFTFGTLILSAALLLMLVPRWFSTFGLITSYTQSAALFLIGLAALCVLLGGTFGLVRLFSFIFGLFLLITITPLMIESVAATASLENLGRAGNILLERGAAAFITSLLPLGEEGGLQNYNALLFDLKKSDILQDFLMGGAFAWIFAQNIAPHERGRTRFWIVLLALIFSFIIITLIGVNYTSLFKMILNEIVGVPPFRWPYFVFEEALHGWLSLCGLWPLSADELAQACKELRGGAAFLNFNASFAPSAFALWHGWPALFGGTTILLIPVLMLCPLALLLHAWGSRFSALVALVLRMPMGLKTARISWMRIGILLACAGLGFAFIYGFTLSPLAFTQISLFAFISIAVGYILAVFSAFFAWIRRLLVHA